jgi:hypothetical protein
MGGLKMVKDDVEELQSIDLDETVKVTSGINLYNWYNDNWVNFSTGEQFTSFKPAKNLQYFRKKIRYLHKINTE